DKNKIELIGKVPYDDKVPMYLSNKKFIIDDSKSEAGKEIINMWKAFSSYIYSD
ncbi:unnamed protein product, partial [marine sediment metagenome]